MILFELFFYVKIKKSQQIFHGTSSTLLTQNLMILCVFLNMMNILRNFLMLSNFKIIFSVLKFILMLTSETFKFK